MIYESGSMCLECLHTVLTNSHNAVYVCRDRNMSDGSMYTLLVIRDHQTMKKYLHIFHNGEEAGEEKKPYICVFSSEQDYCVVFPYKKERKLSEYYMGDVFSLAVCEEICINLILSCITSGIPYPILYLILEQGQIHLAKDNSVYFSYMPDLSNLDENISQKDCVVSCAEILLRLLKPKEKEKAISYLLLEKKVERKSYSFFTELFKDVRIAAISGKKKGIIARIKGLFYRNRDMLFGVLLRVCIVLVLITIITFLSQVIFGDVFFLRLFMNTFKQIGTESLLQ